MTHLTNFSTSSLVSVQGSRIPAAPASMVLETLSLDSSGALTITGTPSPLASATKLKNVSGLTWTCSHSKWIQSNPAFARSFPTIGVPSSSAPTPTTTSPLFILSFKNAAGDPRATHASHALTQKSDEYTKAFCPNVARPADGRSDLKLTRYPNLQDELDLPWLIFVSGISKGGGLAAGDSRDIEVVQGRDRPGERRSHSPGQPASRLSLDTYHVTDDQDHQDAIPSYLRKEIVHLRSRVGTCGGGLEWR